LDRAIDGIEKIIELTKNNQEYTISDQLKSSIRTWNKAMKKFNKLFPIEKEMDEPNDLTMIVDHYTIERESDV
jgi:hypothetical protein